MGTCTGDSFADARGTRRYIILYDIDNTILF